MMLENKFNFEPLIFYRVKKNFKKEEDQRVEPPSLILSKFYNLLGRKEDESANKNRLVFEVNPQIEDSKNSFIIKKNQATWDERMDIFKKFKIKEAPELLKHMDPYLKDPVNSDSNLDELTFADYKIEDQKYSNNEILAKYKKPEIKLMSELCWALCKKIYKTVRYKKSFLNKVPGTFSSNIERLKDLMLGSMKNKIVTKMIRMLPTGGSESIFINRNIA
jgi:hypothetical protein